MSYHVLTIRADEVQVGDWIDTSAGTDRSRQVRHVRRTSKGEVVITVENGGALSADLHPQHPSALVEIEVS